jgi:hypothetical protein
MPSKVLPLRSGTTIGGRQNPQRFVPSLAGSEVRVAPDLFSAADECYEVVVARTILSPDPLPGHRRICPSRHADDAIVLPRGRIHNGPPVPGTEDIGTGTWANRGVAPLERSFHVAESG